MAAAIGIAYSPPSPLALHYPDTASSIYINARRPMRPLPKRRLRERLSAEVADSILHPPAISPLKPLFKFPYSELATRSKTSAISGDISEAGALGAAKHSDGQEEGKDSYQFKGSDLNSDDEYGITLRHHQVHRQRPLSMTSSSYKNGYAHTRGDVSKLIKPPISQSTVSPSESNDGYDSFENTNNKKKRKIPTSGSLGGHQSSLSAEMAHMGISSLRDVDVAQADGDSGVGHYYGTGSSATPAVSSGNGISGAGRGRYGRAGTRHHSGRSPLGVSVNGSNMLQAGRSFHHRKEHPPSGGAGHKEAASAPASDQGIISTAIKNAAALSSTPARGQENISLLEQQSSKRAGSVKTQFTFTCESDSAKSMVWPSESPSSRTPFDEDMPHGLRSRTTQAGRATQGTQTSPNTLGQAGQPATHQNSANTNPQTLQRPKKPQRSLTKQYNITARDRRLQQEYSNYHHPPKPEDVWICEFCEYESIFGIPPVNLVRQYEAKDRRERKRLAEKRRLLEKAKMKGRKGKKGNKTMKNGAVHAQPSATKPQHEVDHVAQQQGTQSEEYVLDDYDDSQIHVPSLPSQAPSKIPQPINQNQNHSIRPPSGSGTLSGASGASQDSQAYF